MTDCPSLEELERYVDVREHVLACEACRIVIELVEQRHAAEADRERRSRCARFELLIAARLDRTLGAAAATLLDEHLAECDDCRELSETSWAARTE